jgi:hypothetical protein
MQRLGQLSQHQVEVAFKFLDRLWEPHVPILPHNRVPKCLNHLEEEEWQVLGAALVTLYEEKEHSNLH